MMAPNVLEDEFSQVVVLPVAKGMAGFLAVASDIVGSAGDFGLGHDGPFCICDKGHYRRWYLGRASPSAPEARRFLACLNRLPFCSGRTAPSHGNLPPARQMPAAVVLSDADCNLPALSRSTSRLFRPGWSWQVMQIRELSNGQRHTSTRRSPLAIGSVGEVIVRRSIARGPGAAA